MKKTKPIWLQKVVSKNGSVMKNSYTRSVPSDNIVHLIVVDPDVVALALLLTTSMTTN